MPRSITLPDSSVQSAAEAVGGLLGARLQREALSCLFPVVRGVPGAGVRSSAGVWLPWRGFDVGAAPLAGAGGVAVGLSRNLVMVAKSRGHFVAILEGQLR